MNQQRITQLTGCNSLGVSHYQSFYTNSVSNAAPLNRRIPGLEILRVSFFRAAYGGANVWQLYPSKKRQCRTPILNSHWSAAGCPTPVVACGDFGNGGATVLPLLKQKCSNAKRQSSIHIALQRLPQSLSFLLRQLFPTMRQIKYVNRF